MDELRLHIPPDIYSFSYHEYWYIKPRDNIVWECRNGVAYIILLGRKDGASSAIIFAITITSFRGVIIAKE
jgi:hypothetical protein